MKILIINWQDIKNPYGGGAEVHLHEIFKRIVSLDNDVTLLCCKFKGAPESEVLDGIKIIRKGNRNLFNFYVPFIYKKLIKKENFDIIIDDINKIPFYTPLFVKKPLLAISHHFFGKSIFKEAGLIRGLYVYISEKLVDYVYKQTPFAVVSESTKNEFVERGFNPKLFTIIQNAIYHKQFPMKIGIKESKPTVTYFGRLKKYKSIEHLIYAFARISSRIKEAQLYIMGTGDYRSQLESIAMKLKLYDRIKFFGYVTDVEKIVLLSASHCVVNTSMKEGWGITNIEANACGTPVISADVPGLKDSVNVGESGLLYEYGNIEQLGNKIIEILTNEDLRHKLSVGAINWAKRFSWDDSAQLMIRKCQETIENFNKHSFK